MVALNADTDHVIDWYHAARGGRGRESSTGAVIAYQPGVQDAVGDKARSLASSAWLQLAWHRRTGAASIKVQKHDLDWYVMLTDPDPSSGSPGRRMSRVSNVGGTNEKDRSAMSIEFGWVQTHVFGKKLAQPIRHEGLHILQNAVDQAARRYGGR